MNFLDAATEAIRDAGGRFTNQRRIVVELMAGSEDHFDAEELYHRAHAQDESISLATVYRTLHALEDAGLIDQHYLTRDHDRKVYEPAGEAEHYHFTCRQCHRVIEFQADEIDLLRQGLESAYGVRVDRVCMCLDGLCAECRSSGEIG